MKKSMMLLSVIFAIFTITSSVSAESSKTERRIVLKPEAGSVVLEKVELIHNADNSVSVTMSGSGKAGVRTEYNLKVNQLTNTYTAKQSTSIEKHTNDAQILGDPGKYYTVHVKAITRDIVNIECNYTDLGKTWFDDGLGTGYASLSHASRSLSTGDGNPTAAGTNWYLVSANYYNPNPPYHSDESAQATHVNYNFLGGGYTTYATHNISIYPQPSGFGNYNFYSTLTTSGNGAVQYLLHIDTVVY